MYGLLKLYKPNYPLRPLMSATKTVGYCLGKLLTNRRSHLRHTASTVKNSFDVNSLLLLPYVMKYIRNQMYLACAASSLPEQRQNKKKEADERDENICRYQQCRKQRDFRKLLEGATSETHFLFENKFSVQHEGILVRVSVVFAIADISMVQLETSVRNEIKELGASTA